MTSRRRTLTAILTFAATVAFAAPVAAQESVSIQIREAELSDDGTTRLVVSLEGDELPAEVLGGEAFTITEAGEPVENVTVTPLLESEPASIGVMLVVDVSGSTAGAPLAAARAAAGVFAEDLLGRGGNVGVVSFGPTAALLAPLGGDAGSVAGALAALTAEGETALYDGIALAAESLREFEGIRQIVVFSDGADTVSTTTLEQATTTAAALEAPVTTVALVTDALDRPALDALAVGTGGRVIEAADGGSLSAAFATAATAIASQYVLTYEKAVPATDPELDIGVTVALASGTASAVATVLNPRRVPSGGPAPSVIEPPGPLAEPQALIVGIVAAFLALLLLVGFLVMAVRDKTEERLLSRSLKAYTTGGDSRSRTRDLNPQDLSKRAAALVDRLPKPEGFEEALQLQIDRAAWPLRASEFLVIQIASGVAGGLLVWSLTTAPLLAVAAVILGAVAPRLVLAQRVSQRSSAFMEQLPDTLGLLAGSLRAGYGLVQAVDTVVREASSPTSEEFARTLTETRLGMPLSDALEGMAERTGSEDFGWVVMAINIQNEVGGNLAQLLETVANTLREREQVRRQVRTLSAEGKLSAYVLIGLVPAMALYMYSVNKPYVSLLWTTSMGRTMTLVGLGLLGIGIYGIRKVIQIDV